MSWCMRTVSCTPALFVWVHAARTLQAALPRAWNTGRWRARRSRTSSLSSLLQRCAHAPAQATARPSAPPPRQAWTPRRSSGAASSPSPRRSASCPSSTPPTRALPAATWSATRPPSACSPAPAWRCCSRRATPRTWCRPRCGVFLFSCHDGTAGGCSQGLPRSREQANAPRVSLGSARGACLGAGISCPFVSSCLASEPGGRPGALIAATRH